MTIDRPEFDLSQCDREPIHIPGQIQPFGFLIACSPDTWLITHVSGNAKMGDASIREVLGKPLSEVIGKDATHAWYAQCRYPCTRWPYDY
jgi:light-regulated signal transduction histidine kinase (bacteriophytochrome)